ncbi:DUF5709 domain-containing protein [Jatrophihabitans sp.]|uniref:DUF5709 domain-containing protein n=1 Tax=Jatrophihabitans sp. TaxID=1932789 RepID=UPI002BF42020|nr:DUF5709 domain-containing protein [Jatrophihabitans sp.]
MSESDDTTFGDEVYTGGDDDAEYLDPAETLTGDGVELDEPLDTSYSPPDFSPVATRYGNTAAEQAEGESLDQRLAQEIPDVSPDDVTAEEPAPRAGRLVAPDEGAHEDTEAAEVAFDVGKAGSAATAEEAAMHVVEEDELNEQDSNEEDLTGDPVDGFR